MSRTTDLPTLAWEVLTLIQSGTPLAGDPQIVWARAFEQINWVASRGGVRVLTADGMAALQERSTLTGAAKAQG